ncbi:MAG: N-acetylmuramoyl-L-alanine amidase [Gemmatimonadetes bacterium]|nr:N-acetylmuramoyl-L-alanine amidase [Gemmatimonadota bacterium]
MTELTSLTAAGVREELLLQLVDEPYRFGDDVWVPLQLLTDFLPSRLADGYAFEADPPTLRVLEAELWSEVLVEPGSTGAGATTAGEPPSTARASPPPAAPDPSPRVVVIDPGHGGGDPGAMGVGGLREKDVALAVALVLAEELRTRPGLEVHLTRDADRLVPIWGRGQWATDVKGSRPGVFISLHANAVSRRDARGFETYFLSEARTEHERRVAALENAPLERERAAAGDGEVGLDFILKDLHNLDHAHWSALLAELIQDRMAPVHPGPNRGVKQAPLAVITNALMPAVLVELGFITNREEERVLGRPAFHADAARALADAVMAFFERYPPGSAGVTGGGP